MNYRFNSRADEDSFIDDNGDHHLANYDSQGRAYYADRQMARTPAKRTVALAGAVSKTGSVIERLKAHSLTITEDKGIGQRAHDFIRGLKKDEILALCISDELRPFDRGLHREDMAKARKGNKAAANRIIPMMVKDFLYADLKKRMA